MHGLRELRFFESAFGDIGFGGKKRKRHALHRFVAGGS